MKQDWRANDFGSRLRMNQPTWVCSGIVGGPGDPANTLRVWFSPGRWRFQHVGANQTYAVVTPPGSFGHPAEGNTYYTYFLQASGDVVAVGSVFSDIPGRPFWDSEYLGRVFTGVSLSTTNVVGPHTSSDHELRGEDFAVDVARPRTVYDEQFAAAGGSVGDFRFSNITASGIAYLNMQDANSAATLVTAAVTWTPSGVPASGHLVTQFELGFRNTKQSSQLKSLAIWRDTVDVQGATLQSSFNPDGTRPLVCATRQLFVVPSGGNDGGYSLFMGNISGEGGAAWRVRSVCFTAQPLIRGDGTRMVIED